MSPEVCNMINLDHLSCEGGRVRAPVSHSGRCRALEMRDIDTMMGEWLLRVSLGLNPGWSSESLIVCALLFIRGVRGRP